MFSFTRTLSFLSLSLTVTACTVTGKPYQEHQSDTRKEREQAEVMARPENLDPSSEATGWEARFDAAKDPLPEVLSPLADRVLDPKRITDKHARTSRAVMDELIMFNRLLLKTPKDQRARPEFLALLERYRVALETECGAGEPVKGCTGLLYFQISGNSEQVAKLIAQNDPAHYFRMLLFAIDLKNVYWDAEIARMLFENPEQGLSQAESKTREAVRSMMGAALQTAREKNPSPERQREFLESIHAWKLTTGEIQGFDQSTQAALLEMIAGSKYMYTANGSLHPEFQAMVQGLENQADGFFAAQSKLHEAKLFSADSIGAQYVQHFDEVYFLIDSVFTGKITAQSAALLFASTAKSAQDLESAVRNYMRIRFLLALNETSQLAKTIFEANVQAQDLLFHFMRESTSIGMVWNGFTSRATPVQNFAILAARKRGDSVQIENEIKSLFDSIQNSINLASADPHTLILFHLLSQKRFELVIPFSGKKYDSGELMRLYFAGKIDPILNYSPVVERFNQFKAIYAFDMGMRTNLFKIVNVDPDFFIADTLRRLNGDVLNDIDKELTAVKTRFNQSLSYTDFKKACAEFEGKPVSRSFYFMEITGSPYYGHVLDDAFISATDKGTRSNTSPGGLDFTTMGIYYPDNNYDEMVEKARLDLGTTLRLGKAMLTSYTTHLRQTGASDSDIEEKTKMTRQALAQLEAYRTKVLSTAKTWYDEVGVCYWRAFAKDNEIQLKLLLTEQAYLRQVYHDITKLRSGTASESEKAAIQDRIHFKGLPSGFQGLDRISESGYVYTSIDLYIRFAKYMTEGLTTDEGTIAPLAPGLQIDFGNRLDVDVEAVRASHMQTLPYSDDMNAFVGAGMKRVLNGGDRSNSRYLTWLGNLSSRILNWTDFLTSLTSLYRLEREVKGVNTDFTGQMILDAHTQVLNSLKIGPAERALLRSAYVVSKFDPNPITLDHRLILWDIENAKIQDFWGLYDLPMRLMEEEALGQIYDAKLAGVSSMVIPRWGATDLGNMYYRERARDNRGTTVIPFSADLDRMLDGSLRAFIASETGAVADFQNLTRSYTNRLAQKPVEERPRADINLYQSISSPLLTDTVISSYNSKLKVFNMTTDHCFTSDKICSSFQQ